MINSIVASLEEAQKGLQDLLENKEQLARIESAAETLIRTFEDDNKVLSCGNGGSMCDAMHFAEELTGRFRADRRAYPAIAINDPGHLTCVANDYGYEHVFSRYIDAHGRKGDTLLAISTSGSSLTVINAALTAKKKGMHVIALTGKDKSKLEDISTVTICTAAGQFSDRVQELHIKILHIFIELIERHFHPHNYS